MLFAGIDKGTDALLDDAFAPHLRFGGGRLALRDVLVRPPQQPHRPQRATDANQQHPHPFLLDNPPTLPIEQRALEALPPTFNGIVVSDKFCWSRTLTLTLSWRRGPAPRS